MPRPWSGTANSTTCPRSTASIRTSACLGENLIALPTRLIRVWTTRSASTKTGVFGALDRKPDLGLLGDQLHLADRRRHEGVGRVERALHGDHTGLDPLDVEDVVDQPGQPVAALQGDVDHPAGVRRQGPERAAGEQSERAPDRGQRGPQLVADHRHELALHPVDLAALGDVAEDHDGTGHGVVLDQRGGRHLDGDLQPVRPGVEVVLGAGHRPPADRLGDVAGLDRGGRAVGQRSVEQGVGIAHRSARRRRSRERARRPGSRR